ncbi:hypothetical protein, partial [Kosakonia oryzae]|uniref:hypothetical protein n=1 Tax=Kosakonia oryzae TaxID=497725 RepID=UPI001C31599B
GQTTNNMSGLPEGRAKRVNPPLTAIIRRRARRQMRAFFRMSRMHVHNLHSTIAKPILISLQKKTL